MIKNQKQAALTKSKLKELSKSLSEFQSQKDKLNPIRYKLGVDAFNGLIKDLQDQLEQYERLTNQNINEFLGLQLPDFAKFLIEARLARNMSQKELADKLDIQEQQIQRYELDDYVKASWSRLMEIYHALGLTINLKTITIIKRREAETFELPRDISREAVNKAMTTIKQTHSLFHLKVA
jgi:HTH-type transcriptional regulator/antitoxin HipB